MSDHALPGGAATSSQCGREPVVVEVAPATREPELGADGDAVAVGSGVGCRRGVAPAGAQRHRAVAARLHEQRLPAERTTRHAPSARSG